MRQRIGKSLADFERLKSEVLLACIDQFICRSILVILMKKMRIETILLFAFVMAYWVEGSAQIQFAEAGRVHSSFGSQTWMESADLDNDGDLDIISRDPLVCEGRIHLNDGFGYFNSRVYDECMRQDGILNLYTYSGIPLDANGDGYKDIVVIQWQSFEDVDIGEVRLITHLNDGNANFAVGSELHVADTYFSGGLMTGEDLDRDGDVDLILSSFYHEGAVSLQTYINDGAGRFSLLDRYEISNDVPHLEVEDINNDAFPDLVIYRRDLAQIEILVNNGSGKFSNSQKSLSVYNHSGTFAVMDLNDDGLPDIASTELFFINDGSANFQKLQSAILMEDLYSSDLDADGDDDLLASTYGMTVVYLQHQGEFSEIPEYIFPEDILFPAPVLLEDFNNDGRVDIAFGHHQRVFINAFISNNFAGQLCNSNNKSVEFSSSVRFNDDNEFTVEISDDKGDFNNAYKCGNLKSTQSSGSIDFTVPDDILAGGGYRLRVNSSSPSINGFANDEDITVHTIPLPLLGDDFISCQEDTLITCRYKHGDRYEWITPTHQRVSSKEIEVSQTGSYVVEVNKYNCSFIDTIDIEFTTRPELDFVINDINQKQFPDTLFVPHYPLTLTLQAKGCQDCHLVWNIEKQNSQEGRDVAFSLSSSGLVKFCLTGSNGEGCRREVKKEFFIDQVFIPNVITPNGDGKNDAFIIPVANQQPISLLITNRYGIEVHNSARYDNSWDADALAPGLYYYQILMSVLDEVSQIKGWVQVLK